MFPDITFFAVLREVEALNFVIFGNAQADDGVDNFEDHQCPHDGETGRNADSDGLIHELVRVSFQRTRG